jgi:hypothetical protein
MNGDIDRLPGPLKKTCVGFALVPAILIASAPRAEAILRYYIHDSAGIGRIDAIGTLNLPTPLENRTGISQYCPTNSPLLPPPGGAGLQSNDSTSFLNICTGPAASFSVNYNGYEIASTAQNIPSTLIAPASSYSGLATGLIGEGTAFYIQSSYTGGTIASSALFSGTLASVGISGLGLMASYNVLDGTTVMDTIEVYLNPPPQPVPAPLPVLGASLAFARSRQLRQRAASR